MTETEKLLAGCLQHLLIHYVNDVEEWALPTVHGCTVVKDAVEALRSVGIDYYAEEDNPL